MRLGYNEGMENLIYPEKPTKPGALPRETLIRIAVDENFALSQEKVCNYDLLGAAVMMNSKETIQLCLDLGIPSIDEQSSVLYLIIGGKYKNPSPERTMDLLEVVLGHKGFDRDKLREHSSDVLGRAIIENNIPAFDLLVEHGADAEKANSMGENVIHSLCREAVDIQMAEHILNRYRWLVRKHDKKGPWPLLMAAEKRESPELIYKLLEAGADPIAMEKFKGGLLHIMRWGKYQEKGMNLDGVVENIRARVGKEKWEILIRQEVEETGLPIHSMAVKEDLTIDFSAVAPDGNVDAFRVSIAAGQSENPGQMGARISALGMAVITGRRKTIRSLLRGGADLRKMTPGGHTCWHLWAKMNTGLDLIKETAERSQIKLAQNNIEFARRFFLRSDVSTEELSDDGEHPIKYTDNTQAREFFAQQRRKALASIPQSMKPARRSFM